MKNNETWKTTKPIKKYYERSNKKLQETIHYLIDNDYVLYLSKFYDGVIEYCSFKCIKEGDKKPRLAGITAEGNIEIYTINNYNMVYKETNFKYKFNKECNEIHIDNEVFHLLKKEECLNV